MTLQSPLHYYNRYTKQIEPEHIYGEEWLHWLYGSTTGSIALHALIKRSLASRFYGYFMSKPSSAEHIIPFIEKYNVDRSTFQDPVESFHTFNDFFFRKLKPEARPINQEPGTLCFPADGRHLGFKGISKHMDIFVKGQRLSLSGLVDDPVLEDRFWDGPAVLSRLCPADYHRFHFPVAGIPSKIRPISGKLRSVNPLALRKHISILWTNKRTLTQIQTPNMGLVLMIEIGATLVGGIHQTYSPDQLVQKGHEKGYFSFGGSTTLVIFEKGKVEISDDLLYHTKNGYELYAHMGDVMGHVV